jgi:PQQ-like domain
VDPRTGAIRWSRDLGTRRDYRITAGDGVVMSAGEPWQKSQKTLVSGFRIADGRPLAETGAAGELVPLGVSGGRALFTGTPVQAGDGTGAVVSLDPRTGTSTRVKVPIRNPRTAVDGHMVYALQDSTLYAVDMERRKVVWTAPAGTAARSVAAASGRVLVESETGHVRVLDARDAQQLWQTGPLRTPPADAGGLAGTTIGPLVARGLAFVFTGDHTVYTVPVRGPSIPSGQ